MGAGRVEPGWAFAERALELARRVKNRQALFDAALSVVQPFWGPDHQERRQQVAAEAIHWPRDGVNARTLGTTLALAGLVLLDGGQRKTAEQAWNDLKELAERTADPTVGMNVMMTDSWEAQLEGDLEEAARIGEQMIIHGEEHGSPRFGRRIGTDVRIRPLVWLGRGDIASPSRRKRKEYWVPIPFTDP